MTSPCQLVNLSTCQLKKTMKKNITINLFGTLYAIDEDAYELLNRYLSDMKSYFSRKEGGEEIADDIEHRVGELMQELKADGREPVTIELVKEIIGRIGSPEEMDGGEPADDSTDCETRSWGHRGKEWFTEKVAKKRLYRHPDDKLLCGVLSGISCYFGIDPVWLRLAVVALAIIPIPFLSISFWTVLIAYFILALVIPMAKTPEERLQMQGKPVTMETLNEEIVSNADTSERTAPKRNKPTTILDGVIQVAVLIIKGFIIFMLASIALSGFALLLLVLLGFSALSFVFNSGVAQHAIGMGDDDWFFLQHLTENGLSWVSGIALFIAVVILVYLIIYAIMRLLGKGRTLGRMLWIYLIVFFISLIVGVSSLVSFSMDMEIAEEKWKQEYREHREDRANQERLNWLSARGWQVVAHEHTEKYKNGGEHYSGDRRREYIDSHSEHPNMLYTVERTVHVAPGIYTLEAVVRTNGEGPEIYAFDSDSVRHATSFPVCHNYGGGIWEEATALLKADSTLTGDMARIAKTNKGRGYGWSRIRVENIHITDSIIRYGVTNRSASGCWNGTWFSATDFKLDKMKKQH